VKWLHNSVVNCAGHSNASCYVDSLGIRGVAKPAYDGVGGSKQAVHRFTCIQRDWTLYRSQYYTTLIPSIILARF